MSGEEAGEGERDGKVVVVVAAEAEAAGVAEEDSEAAGGRDTVVEVVEAVLAEEG